MAQTIIFQFEIAQIYEILKTKAHNYLPKNQTDLISCVFLQTKLARAGLIIANDLTYF